MRDTLGKYELVTLMSVGGMAELFLACTPGPGGFSKAVALKQMLPEFRDDPQFVQRFLDEARITSTLTHPHLGQVFDLGESDGELYLAMEFIAGVDLARVSQETPLPAGFVARMARDISLGLASAHELTDPNSGESRALIHRDINPKNVMVTFDGVVKVVDFGLAKFRGRRVKTDVGTVRGTPQYMAPEQLRDEPLDARTDLFGVGVVMWELLTGAFLNPAGVEEVVERLQRNEPAPLVSSLVPGVPDELDALVAKCLAGDKSQRFGSARELSRALERCGVELFDEAQVAALVGERLPQTKVSLRRLVGLAQQPDADDDAIKAELRVLRKADRQKEPKVVTEEVEAPLAPQVVSERRSATEAGPLVVGVAVMALVLGALGFFLMREPEAARSTLDPVAADAQWRGRQALNDGDPLHALEILRGCVGSRGPCQGLETLRAEVDDALTKSPCGSLAQAEAFIEEATRLAAEEAGVKLRGCTAGRVLHPRAAQALQQLELVRPLPREKKAR